MRQACGQPWPPGTSRGRMPMQSWRLRSSATCSSRRVVELRLPIPCKRRGRADCRWESKWAVRRLHSVWRRRGECGLGGAAPEHARLRCPGPQARAVRPKEGRKSTKLLWCIAMRLGGGERPVGDAGFSAVCNRCAVWVLGPLLLGLLAEWDPCPPSQCRVSRV